MDDEIAAINALISQGFAILTKTRGMLEKGELAIPTPGESRTVMTNGSTCQLYRSCGGNFYLEADMFGIPRQISGLTPQYNMTTTETIDPVIGEVGFGEFGST